MLQAHLHTTYIYSQKALCGCIPSHYPKHVCMTFDNNLTANSQESCTIAKMVAIPRRRKKPLQDVDKWNINLIRMYSHHIE